MAFRRKTTLALLALLVLLAATWIVFPNPPSDRAVDSPGVAARPEATAPPSTTDGDTRRVARTRWDDRRAQIRAAHAARAHVRPDSQAPSLRGRAEADCSPDAAVHGGDAVFSAFVDETTTLTQGCEELSEGKPTSVRIAARLIGAPDIGTIVESLEVSGPTEHLDALTECLTEGMYTLEFGDAATGFERDAVLMLGLLDEVAGEGWLTPERVAEIRQQMIDGGLDPAKDPMVAVEADDAAATP